MPIVVCAKERRVWEGAYLDGEPNSYMYFKVMSELAYGWAKGGRIEAGAAFASAAYWSSSKSMHTLGFKPLRQARSA
jgi:hypothetical protein